MYTFSVLEKECIKIYKIGIYLGKKLKEGVEDEIKYQCQTQ